MEQRLKLNIRLVDWKKEDNGIESTRNIQTKLVELDSCLDDECRQMVEITRNAYNAAEDKHLFIVELKQKEDIKQLLTHINDENLEKNAIFYLDVEDIETNPSLCIEYLQVDGKDVTAPLQQIGRASCRERV